LPATPSLVYRHGMKSPTKYFSTLGSMALAIIVIGSSPGVATADEFSERYFNGLRTRRLFSVAEGYCLSRLADETQTLVSRTELTLELSRTLAEHAKFVTGKEQDDLWQRSTAVLKDLIAKDPTNPQRVLLEMQAALTKAGEGEFLRWRSELFPFDDTPRKRATDALTGAEKRLGELQVDLANRIEKARGKGRGSSAFTLYQLKTFRFNARYRRAAVMIDLAGVLPRASVARSEVLLDVEKELRSLAGGNPSEESTMRATILLATCRRMQGVPNPKFASLTGLLAHEPSREIVDRILMEHVRGLLMLRRPDEAAVALRDDKKKRGAFSGELRYLSVRTWIAMWETARDRKDDKLTTELMTRLRADVDETESEISGYWGYRCRLLLAMAEQSAKFGPELALAIRKAQAAYSNGRTQDALRDYAAAFSLARKQNRNDLAMQLGLRRASIELDAKLFNAAAIDFLSLAELFPESPQAADAHLLGAYSLGRQYDGDRTQTNREAYTAGLIDHRTGYPKSPTFSEATWMLAQHEEQRLQVTKALTFYFQVDPKHRRGPASRVAVARCYQKVIDRLRELKRPDTEWRTDAIKHLEEFAKEHPQPLSPLTIEQAEVSLGLARILIDGETPDYARADVLLTHIETSRRTIEKSADAVPISDAKAWRTMGQSAVQLRIVALAGRQDVKGAIELVRRLTESDPSEALGVLDGLSVVADRADAKTRGDLGELQLQSALALDGQRKQMTATERSRLDRCLAHAYVATRQPMRAMRLYEQLVKAAPRDRKLLRTLAELQLACDTRECLEQARKNWRKLESYEKAGSDAWMAARYHVTLSDYRMRKFNDCRKLLLVTRLLYPKSGTPEIRKGLAELQAKLDKMQER
jgi:tetratricopeptide (TPR) repeat protein